MCAQNGFCTFLYILVDIDINISIHKKSSEFCLQTYSPMLPGTLMMVRQRILVYLQDCQVRVSWDFCTIATSKISKSLKTFLQMTVRYVSKVC